MSQLQGIIFLVIVFLNLVLAFWLFIKAKEKSIFYLGLTALFSGIFCFSWAGLYLFETYRDFFLKLTSSGFLIMSAYLIFVYYFTKRTKYIKLKIFFWNALAFILVYFTFTTSLFITDTLSIDYPYVVAETAGPLNFLYRVFVILLSFLIIFYLFREFKKAKEERKSQIKLFLLGVGVYVIGGALFSGLIPLLYPYLYGYVLPLPVIFSFFWIGLTVYSLFKKEIINIRFILSEILIGLIGLVLFIQFLLVPTMKMKALTFFLFILFFILSYRLIKITYSEVEKKEKAKELAKKLSGLNDLLEKRVKERTAALEEERASLEIKVLARTRELKELNETLEEQVGERTQNLQEKIDDLEVLHRVTTDRELKMIELKEEIKSLKEKLKKCLSKK